jgi:hypothetical protein
VTNKSIDLGKKWNDDMGTPISISEMRDQTHYPDLHIGDTDDTRLFDMPDEGEATIRYKVISLTHNERNCNGKKKQSCSITMEIRSIDPPPAKSKKKNGDSDGGARKALNDYFKDK